ncbi:MAG: alkene reductase [Pseudorhodoplanes sp.]|uniref:alkene reductase n=1 Tax=Pseudorhodoplanes sp. TaxID=1934341 RepID=UPI003D141716
MSATSAAAKAPATEPLFEPYQLGPLHLSNRIVMAPMTRSRAIDGNVPNPLAETYYRQRASAGLIITEASQVSPQGQGYIRTPGIHSPEQVAAWRKITAAVAREGGKIFLQLWHVGRISHPDFQGGELPVAPSAIMPDGEVFTAQGPKKMVTPRALDLSELPGIVEQFRKGAENAKAAGFDGVEIHGANGYLLDQFTRDGSNRRADSYGGSLENRVRLPLEVTKAVIGVWGKDRVGYRVSPNGAYNSMSDSNPRETFSYLTRRLSELGIVYLHTFDPPSGANHLAPELRKQFTGTFIVNGGYDEASGNAAIASGDADLVAYGVPFLANPDLPYRFGRKAGLNAPDQATFYAGEDRGYTDYPALAQ